MTTPRTAAGQRLDHAWGSMIQRDRWRDAILAIEAEAAAAAGLRADRGLCVRETCGHGHVDHVIDRGCRWCSCAVFVEKACAPSILDAEQERAK